ncbi:Programmed cell death toxin MazF [hydrothermal vent metagenome]|uniref:Programmed cell death toxin MazF n=1 Tax=hydrothermal vent metagenome TaxID=652676 RepID=A0A3B0UZ35_9ZZZZ
MVTGYIPAKGDFIVVNFNPQLGHEQKGRRPAVVVSNAKFNRATGLAMVCPITNSNRKNPFHISVGKQSSLTGFVMVEQIKSIDYKSRKVKFIETASDSVMNDVLSILDACIYQD